MIRVVLPSHLRMHANVNGEVRLAIDGARRLDAVIRACGNRVLAERIALGPCVHGLPPRSFGEGGRLYRDPIMS